MELQHRLAVNSVEIIEGLGEWFVRVIEAGQERIQSFENETFATSYSDGQRLRLGLEHVTRV